MARSTILQGESAMPLHIFIVQHAEKEPTPGDPELTAIGNQQAHACGGMLARLGPFDEIWSSPLRRTAEIAGHLANALGFSPSTIRYDTRIRERMNWPGEFSQSRAAFRREWERTTADREFQPSFDDSSRAAGARFAAFLTGLHDRMPEGRGIVVAHGGVTVDLVRPWFGDDLVNELAPDAIEHGIPACGITVVTLDANISNFRIMGVQARQLHADHPGSGSSQFLQDVEMCLQLYPNTRFFMLKDIWKPIHKIESKRA